MAGQVVKETPMSGCPVQPIPEFWCFPAPPLRRIGLRVFGGGVNPVRMEPAGPFKRDPPGTARTARPIHGHQRRGCVVSLRSSTLGP